MAMAAILLATAQMPAGATELMLEDESDPPYILYGIGFLTLSLASFSYASQQITESQDNLDKADKNYNLYEDATTTNDALSFRAKVEKFRNRARNAEGRANLFLGLGVIFAGVSLYSFWPELGSAPSIFVTMDVDSLNLYMKF